MIRNIHLQNFKGFRDTDIGPLRAVNLLIGSQNVGKTSVLEAVCAAIRFQQPVWQVNNIFRTSEGNDAQRYENDIFNRNNVVIRVDQGDEQGFALASNDIPPTSIFPGSLQPNATNGYTWHRGYSYRNSAPFPVSTTSVRLPSQEDLAQLFGSVVRNRSKKVLLELLQRVDPRLIGLEVIPLGTEHRIYAELNDIPTALPLGQLGHGFNRLVHLYSELLVTDAKLALIDEVENGIHYSALPTLFKGIKEVTKSRGVQTLVTTHSWDALRAAAEVFADAPDLFQVIRLESDDQGIHPVYIEGDRLLRMIREDMEVR